MNLPTIKAEVREKFEREVGFFWPPNSDAFTLDGDSRPMKQRMYDLIDTSLDRLLDEVEKCVPPEDKRDLSNITSNGHTNLVYIQDGFNMCRHYTLKALQEFRGKI